MSVTPSEGDLAEPCRQSESTEDRLSALPDHLLQRILSPFETFFVARTSVLSRRWRHLWTCVPNLNFTDELFADDSLNARFLDCIDRALLRHNSPVIEKLTLKISQPSSSDRVDMLVRYAVEHTVQELYLIVINREEDGHVLLPFCDSLRRIKVYGRSKLPPPPYGSFNSLEELEIGCTQLTDNSLRDLVSSCCPRLRVLRIHHISGLKDLNISSPSLERLNIGGTEMSQLVISAQKLRNLDVCMPHLSTVDVLEISAPCLETFGWLGPLPAQFSLGELSSLMCAHIALQPHYPVEDWSSLLKGRWTKYFRNIAHANHLHSCLIYWKESQSECLDLFEEMTTPLHGIKILSLEIHSEGHAYGGSISCLLMQCPNIRKLFVNIGDCVGDEEADARSPESVCNGNQNWKNLNLTLDSLQEVDIFGFRGENHEIEFVKLVLKCAKALEKMTISSRKTEEPLSLHISKEILECNKASSAAVISFS